MTSLNVGSKALILPGANRFNRIRGFRSSVRPSIDFQAGLITADLTYLPGDESRYMVDIGEREPVPVHPKFIQVVEG